MALWETYEQRRAERAAKMKSLLRVGVLISVAMCAIGILLEFALFLRHWIWGGYPADARLAIGLFGALLINLYLLWQRRSISKWPIT